MLTDEQSVAAAHRKGVGLTLAVPGSGKTTVLLARIDQLIREGTPSRKILSLSFGKRQVMDMKARYILHAKQKVPFHTIHAYAYGIYRRWAKEHHLHYELIEGRGALKKIDFIKGLCQSLYGFTLPPESLHRFFSLYGFVKNKRCALEEALSLHPQWIAYKKLFELYEKEKQVNRWIDFEDMLTLTSIFLGEDAFRRKIHPDFQYIQLDEAQDASELQFSFLERLSYPEHNLFFLADDDQSIYGFRGASPEYLLHIQQSFPKVKVYALSENHRSAPNLVTLASKIIGENTHRYEKSVTAKNQSPGKIRFEAFGSVEKALKKISRLLQKEAMDTAILYRNHLSALPWCLHFGRQHIPYTGVFPKTPLHPVLEDILSLLDFIAHPERKHDFLKQYRKLNIPKEHALLASEGIDDNVFENLSAIPPRENNPYRYLQLKKIMARIKGSPADKAFNLLLNAGYKQFLKDRQKREKFSPASLRYLSECILTFGKNKTIPDFLKEMNALIHPQSEGNIHLNTIHGVKGLEFDRVILMDLVDGEFPSNAHQISPEDLEEERRLFYVGLTRARKECIFVTFKKRNGENVTPSAFYLEAKKKHMDI